MFSGVRLLSFFLCVRVCVFVQLLTTFNFKMPLMDCNMGDYKSSGNVNMIIYAICKCEITKCSLFLEM